MSLLVNKKNIFAILIATNVLVLSGCGLSQGYPYQQLPNTPPSVSAPLQSQPTQQMVTNAQFQSFETSGGETNSNSSLEGGVTAKNIGLSAKSNCIKQLDSLKTISPANYNSLMKLFKELSDINAMYRKVEGTASKDSLNLMKMSIESKTEVLCARVRYLSVMSVNSTLKKLGE